jgi:hypothetical protein
MPANTDIITVQTSQAPDAKPVYNNLVLSTNYQEIIRVPQYLIPELVFGGSEVLAQGVGEIISPLILCNSSANTVTVDVHVYRYVENITFYLVRNLSVPAYDTIPIPLNGQFLKTGDILEAKASENLAVYSTLSYTLGQSEEDDV